ncbi:hypothetical protein Hanom_Chr07g00665331 [Helianthus anomalus]
MAIATIHFSLLSSKTFLLIKKKDIQRLLQKKDIQKLLQTVLHSLEIHRILLSHLTHLYS